MIKSIGNLFAHLIEVDGNPLAEALKITRKCARRFLQLTCRWQEG
jgi:hypothetical protein